MKRSKLFLTFAMTSAIALSTAAPANADETTCIISLAAPACGMVQPPLPPAIPAPVLIAPTTPDYTGMVNQAIALKASLLTIKSSFWTSTSTAIDKTLELNVTLSTLCSLLNGTVTIDSNNLIVCTYKDNQGQTKAF